MQDRSTCPLPTENSPTRTRELVLRMQQSEIYRDYQDAFEATTGLPLTLRAAGSFQPPQAGSKRLNAFCALMAGRSKSCAACLQLQQRAEREAAAGARTIECFAGLSDSVVPIRVGEDVIAYLQTGQVLLRPSSPARFQKTLQQLRAWGVEFDTAKLEAAYFQTRVLRKAHYESAVRLLAIFAQQISGLANQLMVQGAQAEAPVVTRARTYIAENLVEDLTLTQVAAAVNMSAFYFCKVFKKETGLTFTDYVARVRLEAVKQMLLNPHTRISEAAYAAGFQSLSQFNRTFRRISGEAPTTYREKLHGSTPAATHHSLAA
ncbi:MAG: helix-turn-helix domain-containing protein [Verrucomicrobia bacterium]|nr:helix-turn-helix domain-containing protein [Verrucomicrobiota bacterium]